MEEQRKTEAPSTQSDEALLLQMRDQAEKVAESALKVIGETVHPNRITAMRIPIGAAAVATHTVSATAGTILYAVNTLIDWLDGAAARAARKGTTEGAKLDPLVDKVVNGGTMGYLIASGQSDPLLTASALLAAASDALSQLQRGPVVEQTREAIRAVLNPEACHSTDLHPNVGSIKANVWGKVKMCLQSGSIAVWMAGAQHEEARVAAAAGLGASAVLGLIGTIKRWKSR